jgi:hypothetical protein
LRRKADCYNCRLFRGSGVPSTGAGERARALSARPIDVGIVNKGRALGGAGENHESEPSSRIAGPQGGHDAHLHGRWRRHPRDGARRVQQPRHPGQDRKKPTATRLQVAFGARKASRVTKPAAGHLAKAGVEAGEVLKEFRVDADVAGPVQARRHAAVTCSPPARRSTCRAPRSARASPAPSSATTSLAARVARQQPFAQRAGLDLDGAGPGPRVPGQEDDRPHGRRDRHHAEPRHRARRRERARCCWCAVRCRVRRTAMWSCARPSRPRPRREPK